MSGAKSYKSKIELYTSIDDLPVFNFWELCSLNFEYLIKKGQFTGQDFTDKWYKIYDEFLEIFGTSAEFRMIADAKKRIALLQCKRLIQGMKSLDSAIRVEERQLQEQMVTKVDPLSTEKQVIYLEQHYKTSIDPKTCPTKKFYTYIKMLA